MFTGLIEEIGVFDALKNIGNQQIQIKIGCKQLQDDLKIGDSVAVDGACLTVVKFDSDSVTMDLSPETLKLTLFSNKKNGSKVNLERALRFGDRLGGHLVQGHVDALSQLLSVKQLGTSVEMTFSFQPEVKKYFVQKGSVTINGISLTLANVEGNSFTVAIIPHTYRYTTLIDLQLGDQVHIETDILVRYVENLLFNRDSITEESPITLALLQKSGW